MNIMEKIQEFSDARRDGFLKIKALKDEGRKVVGVYCGFAITDKCPYFYFSDMLIGETTCDGKKNNFRRHKKNHKNKKRGKKGKA